jgi:hypothetical protein
MTLFSKGSSESQKGLWLSYVTSTLELRRNKQVLSQLAGFPVTTCLPSTRTPYSKMCPIKGPTRWNNRIVEELEEDANRKSSDCK